MKIKIYKVIYVFLIFLATYFAFISSNSDNPVDLGYSNAQRIYDIAPQGWAFFTRDPKERVVRLYKIQKNELIYINKTTSLSSRDIFGVKRDKRWISIELAGIIANVETSKKWEEFRNTTFHEAAKSLEITDTVKVKKNSLLDEGEYMVCISRRLPWAWAKADVKLPYRAKKIILIAH